MNASESEILNKMFKASVKVPLTDNYGKKKVELSEPQHPKSSVIIYGIPDNAIIIKADAFTSPDSIFDGSHGECKRADFVIFAETDNQKTILCIEMKAKKDSENQIIQQLKGARCFVTYCREIGNAFWDKKNFLKDYRYRFISVGRTAIPKQKTRITRQKSIHDSPEKMLKIANPHHIQFNHLAGSPVGTK